jgi:hypothetical protein
MQGLQLTLHAQKLLLKLLSTRLNGMKARGAAKPKNEELKLLNNYLEDVRGKLFTHYRDLKIDEAVLTAEAVKNYYTTER